MEQGVLSRGQRGNGSVTMQDGSFFSSGKVRLFLPGSGKVSCGILSNSQGKNLQNGKDVTHILWNGT